MYEDDKDFKLLNKKRAKVRIFKALMFSGLFFILINVIFNYFLLSVSYTAAMRKGVSAAEHFVLKKLYFYSISTIPLPMVIMISLIIGMLITLRLETNWRIKNENKTVKGKQRFMNTDELKKLLYSFPCDDMACAEKSGIILAQENGRYYIDAETIHSLIIGTTRSGKGQTFVMPMIRHIAMSQAKHSMVINDPKGEIAENCYDILIENGYDVKFLNLRDTNKSSLWNPLQKCIDEYRKARETDGDLTKTIDEVQSLAAVFTHNDKSDPIWPESAKSLLVAMILYMLETAYEDGNLANVSLYSIYNMFIEFGTENEAQSINGAKRDVNALDSLFQSLPRGSAAKAAYATSRFSSGDCRSSIFTTLASNIGIFGSDSGISKLTSGNQIRFEDLARPDKPMAIIMIVPDEKKSRHVIASLFINQCYNALVDYANNYIGQKLPQRVHFILDEFGNMVPIPDMDTKITVGAGRNLLFSLFVQDLNQLDTKYDNASKTIRSNSGNLVYINSLDDDTNKYVSSILGDRTIEFTTYSGDLHSFLSHRSGSVENYPLIRPEDLGELPFGSAITKRQRCYPIKSKLDPFFKLSIKAKSLTEITGSMTLIHKSLDETIYPLDTIWDRLFVPIKDEKGFVYKAEPRNEFESHLLEAQYTRNGMPRCDPFIFENHIFRRKEEDKEWQEMKLNDDTVDSLAKVKVRNYISEDGNTRTLWDNKRKEIYEKIIKSAFVKTDNTDYTDKQAPPASPLEEALHIINSPSELAPENSYNRFIDEKNREAAEKLIAQAFTKRLITKSQYTMLKKNICGYFND